MVVVAVAVVASLVAGLIVRRLTLRSAAGASRAAGPQPLTGELALEDRLTGMPNQRAFDDRLHAELGRAAREYYPVAVVAIEPRAAVSDETLAALARHVQAELRAGDLCGRTGAGQFMLALVRADAHAAERVIGRLRAAVDVSADRVELNAGIAEFPRHGDGRAELVRAARSALSAGKSGGSVTAIHSTASGPAGEAARRLEHAGRQRGLVETLEEMAQSVDAKNRFTVGHAERVARYADALARSLGFSQDRLAALRQAALLHDVGKIGIRETILAKEAPLNLEELSELERHSELGRAMLSGAGLPEIARWVNHVHERFDGDGYPYGLAGRDIPMESRILHVADALDQMTRPNALRRNRPLREAMSELSYASGSRIDPEIAARAIDMVQSGELGVGAMDAPKPASSARHSIGKPMGIGRPQR